MCKRVQLLKRVPRAICARNGRVQKHLNPFLRKRFFYCFFYLNFSNYMYRLDHFTPIQLLAVLIDWLSALSLIIMWNQINMGKKPLNNITTETLGTKIQSAALYFWVPLMSWIEYVVNRLKRFKVFLDPSVMCTLLQIPK